MTQAVALTSPLTTPAPPRDATNHLQTKHQDSNSSNNNNTNRGPQKQRNKNSKKKNGRHHHHTVGHNNDNNNSTTKPAKKEVIKPSSHQSLSSVVDPRGFDPTKRMTKATKGRNTESFDPSSTLVRPALRVQIGSPTNQVYTKILKDDDVVIVPELFGFENDYTLYNQLVEEMKQLQDSNIKGSEYISWHEGAHLIVKNPKGSTTFNKIIDRLCDYFHITNRQSIGTRFNWYKDSLDWKPFHHDSAAFNPQRAKSQNITVGVSFGATRELAFLRATDENNNSNSNDNNNNNQQQCRLYFPQPNNGVFSFGRDVNIHWKHGINALSEEEIANAEANSTTVPRGRISIILWGLATNIIEEGGSPPLLGSDGNGPHASSNYNNNNKYYNKNRGNNKNHRHHNHGHQRGGGRNNNNGNNKNKKQQGGSGTNNKENLQQESGKKE